MTICDYLVEQLYRIGIRQAFGVVGGGIAYLYDSIARSSITLFQFRHESGAAYAAAEAYFASGAPTLVFATTGPGVLNGLTGITAARWEGAKVLLLSGSTSPDQRGAWAIQETSHYSGLSGLLLNKDIFDFCSQPETSRELEMSLRRLVLGFQRPQGFIAHIVLSGSLQSIPVTGCLRDYSPSEPSLSVPGAGLKQVEECADLLCAGRVVIWLGFGATLASDLCARLARITATPVCCSPRAKGCFPEDDPLYLGVSGIGGHESFIEYMQSQPPDWLLVLGSRLGEATSLWDQRIRPRYGFIQVDLDAQVFGNAYPGCKTIGIQTEISLFVAALVQHFEKASIEKKRVDKKRYFPAAPPFTPFTEPEINWRVCPRFLMAAIQYELIDKGDTLIMSESGNAFLWANHYLRFPKPYRYRTSTTFGAMGHFSAGVVGAALALESKVVAVVGDGAFLMHNEISTAVNYNAMAVWIVLNDGGYGICRAGLAALGLSCAGMDFIEVDFVAMARAQGGDGLSVSRGEELSTAIQQAMLSTVPFVLDVKIDTTVHAPLSNRIKNIISNTR